MVLLRKFGYWGTGKSISQAVKSGRHGMKTAYTVNTLGIALLSAFALQGCDELSRKNEDAAPACSDCAPPKDKSAEDAVPEPKPDPSADAQKTPSKCNISSAEGDLEISCLSPEDQTQYLQFRSLKKAGCQIVEVAEDIQVQCRNKTVSLTKSTCSATLNAELSEATFSCTSGESFTVAVQQILSGPTPEAVPVESFCPANAVTDELHGRPGKSHAMFIFNLDRYDLVEETARLEIFDDGTGVLSGKFTSQAKPDRAFFLHANLYGLTDQAPKKSPKLELKSSSYASQGGPIDPALWRYFKDYSGTLEGLGAYDGALLQLEPRGPAFQLGTGVNGKNGKNGASSWFTYKVVMQPHEGAQTLRRHYGEGDFNLDLNPCEEPPTDPYAGLKQCNDEVFALIAGGQIDFNNAIGPFEACLAGKSLTCNTNSSQVFQQINACFRQVPAEDPTPLTTLNTCLAQSNPPLGPCGVVFGN